MFVIIKTEEDYNEAIGSIPNSYDYTEAVHRLVRTCNSEKRPFTALELMEISGHGRSYLPTRSKHQADERRQRNAGLANGRYIWHSDDFFSYRDYVSCCKDT